MPIAYHKSVPKQLIPKIYANLASLIKIRNQALLASLGNQDQQMKLSLTNQD
jgi:hypothetical protein